MKTTILLASFISLLFTATANWYTDFDEAKTLAAANNEYMLLNFSGSDWCIGCIKMEKELFSSPDFEAYAKEHLVLVKADFPRLKKNRPTTAQQKQNDELAGKYNPNGYFPYTVLLDPSGKLIRGWEGFYAKGADSFINEINAATGHQ